MAEFDKIAVVDFGGQYAHLIGERIRQEGVLAEICQPDDPISVFEDYKGIVLSGSPAKASSGELHFNSEILRLPIPILGICFGHQELAKEAGGQVAFADPESGPATLRITRQSPIFKGVANESIVWMSHGDTVIDPGSMMEVGVSYVNREDRFHPNAAIADDENKRYGFQFHPEVGHTKYGRRMLRNFAVDICGCSPTWTMENFIDEEVEKIRRQVGDKDVFLLVSGGVDSTVSARLLAQALPPRQLHFLHIDNGLMRKDESREVIEVLQGLGLGSNLHFLDATDRFMSALEGLVDPEDKRKVIGAKFIEIAEEKALEIGLDDMILAQGTIYPDTIESGGTRHADTIKTHHNRVKKVLEKIAEGRIIEPLRELYKLEVRKLGERLGLPESIVWRDPFPGPGLGIRLLCSDGNYPPGWEDVGGTNTQIEDVLDGSGLSGRAMPVRSVGVTADLRNFRMPIFLQGDTSFGALCDLAARLHKSVSDINRTVLDLSGIDLKSVQPRAATTTKERLDLLREADAIVNDSISRHKMSRVIWQCPVVMMPVSVDGLAGEYVAVHPVHSERGMTATPVELPRKMIRDLTNQILNIPGIVGLGLDVSTKPPGTIEWE